MAKYSIPNATSRIGSSREQYSRIENFLPLFETNAMDLSKGEKFGPRLSQNISSEAIEQIVLDCPSK